MLQIAIGFSILSLCLCAIGIAGVLNQTVARRRRELGIKAALGATPVMLARDVMLHCVGWLSLGVTSGSIAAYWLLQVLRNQIPALLTPPWWVTAGSIAVMVVVGLSAAAVPVHRAALTDPGATLKAT